MQNDLILLRPVFLFLFQWDKDDAAVVLVGNNYHLEKHREVTREMGEMVAAGYGAAFFEVSAWTGVNINEVCPY